MSWQNLALSWFLRRSVRALRRTPIDVVRVRTGAEKRVWPTRPASGWTVREQVADATRPRGEWIVPHTGSMLDRKIRRTVLYLHGGGYFFCSPRTHRSITCALARHAMARVFALDYRLAPEHPAPAALEDAVAAWRALRASGVPASQIAIAGDSAGGGLALALVQALRDAGEALPATVVLFSPWTDMAISGASIAGCAATDVLFDVHGLQEAAALVVGQLDLRDPRISPLYGTFEGLPPLLIHASDSEMLLDDARRVADAARNAGVDVTWHLEKGVPHVWQMFAPILPEARRALREAGLFIRQRVRQPESTPA